MAARSKRGAISQTWWSERFINVLESLGVGGRLSRGRTYARKGQVLELHVEAGAVTATVQGSRARPYRVRVGVSAYGKREWSRICEALTNDAWYTAKLLAGQMPDDIEGVFAAEGLSLFPASDDELSMDCTCPDWEVPCKHLAAVVYLLAEKFDDDPFMILAWRGRGREELLDTLSAMRTGAVAADHAETVDSTPRLSACMQTYFSAPADLPTPTPAPAQPDSLLDQLPAIDVSIRGIPLVNALRPVYRALDDADDANPQ